MIANSDFVDEIQKGHFVIYVNKLGSKMFLKCTTNDGKLINIQELNVNQVIKELSPHGGIVKGREMI